MIFNDFSKALNQIGDPAFRKVLIRSLLITLALLGPFIFGFSAFLQWIIPESVSIPFYGPVTFLDNLASGIGFVVLLFLTSFLMIPVAVVFIGLSLDQIAAAVEAKFYPHLPQVPGQPLGDAVIDAVKFLMVLALVNMLALIIYFASTLLAPVIFWLVNGLMLGREYFQTVAMRRLGRKEADALRRKHGFTIWMAGVLMAIPLTVPVLNLIVPILGVATFTHLFHRLDETR
ncbi:MAG: CysZ protein [Paracoccaceae bacterium]|jgi:CysZ protein